MLSDISLIIHYKNETIVYIFGQKTLPLTEVSMIGFGIFGHCVLFLLCKKAYSLNVPLWRASIIMRYKLTQNCILLPKKSLQSRLGIFVIILLT